MGKCFSRKFLHMICGNKQSVPLRIGFVTVRDSSNYLCHPRDNGFHNILVRADAKIVVELDQEIRSRVLTAHHVRSNQ